MSDNPARRLVRDNIEERHEPGPRSPQDQAELHPTIQHFLIQGLSDSEIARQTGIDRKAVAAMRKKAGRPADIHPVSGQVVKGQESDRVTAECLRLRDLNLSYVQIAEEVGLSWQSVRGRLRNAYKDYMLEQRDAVSGRQVADLEVMRNELLDIIIREDSTGELTADLVEQALESGDYSSLAKKMSDKAKAELDSKFKAMDLMVKLMDREAKLFGLDAASQVNVNHNIKVDPESIELMQELQLMRQKTAIIDNIVDVEVVEPFDLGNPEG